MFDWPGPCLGLCVVGRSFPLYLCRRLPVDAGSQSLHIFPLSDDGRVRACHPSDAPSLRRDVDIVLCHLRFCHETLADTLFRHVAVSDGGGAQRGGSRHRNVCLWQLVAGEATVLRDAPRAGGPWRQSSILRPIPFSRPCRAGAGKGQFRGFPFGFHGDEGGKCRCKPRLWR